MTNRSNQRPFAQWSSGALGAGSRLPFAPTNSSRFLLRRTAHRADASLVCPIDVNDVLSRTGRFFKPQTNGSRCRKPLKIGLDWYAYGAQAWWHGSVGRTNHPYLRPTGNQFRKPTIGADGKSGRNCYQIRGISTDGSARHSHCRGQGFDSPMLHKKTLQIKVCKVFS